LILDKKFIFSFSDIAPIFWREFNNSTPTKPHLANPAKGNVPYFLQSSIAQ